MEHAMSDLLVDRIDEYLGRPEVDPHGDPIPRADGSVISPSYRSLAMCHEGDRFRLVRVVDQSPDFLRYLTAAGLPLGVEGHVAGNRAEAGLIIVEVAGQTIYLGRSAAEKILITEA